MYIFFETVEDSTYNMLIVDQEADSFNTPQSENVNVILKGIYIEDEFLETDARIFEKLFIWSTNKKRWFQVYGQFAFERRVFDDSICNYTDIGGALYVDVRRSKIALQQYSQLINDHEDKTLEYIMTTSSAKLTQPQYQNVSHLPTSLQSVIQEYTH